MLTEESPTVLDPSLHKTSATQTDLLSSLPEENDKLPDFGRELDLESHGTFGGYNIIRLIGRGGMGAVYEAIDTALNRRIALKILLPKYASHERGRNNFLREARAASAIRSDHVVTVHTVGEYAGLPFFSMELLEGANLEQYLKSGERSISEIVRIGREIALGLSAAHERGLVHRDIKPENVWIESQTGRVKLLDFGLVWTIDDLTEKKRSRQFVGTPLFASPEQARGEHVDIRSDLFSLGAIFYRAVTGRPPFQTSSVSKTVAALATGIAVPVRDRNPSVPVEFAELIDRLLSSRPEDRPAHSQVVAEELLTISTSLLLQTGDDVCHLVDENRLTAWNLDTATFGDDSNSAIAKLPAKRLPARSLGVPLWASALFILFALIAVSVFFVVISSSPSQPTRPAAPSLVPVIPAVLSPAVAPDSAPKFQMLISGNTLAGLSPPPGGKMDRWTIDDGVLIARAGSGDQFLLTDREFMDYELDLEYRWRKGGGHTTLMLRAKATANGNVEGVSINLGDDEGFPAIHGREIGAMYRTGVIQGIQQQASPSNKTIGEWNRLHIVVSRQQIDIQQNGAFLSSVDLDTQISKVVRFPAIARSRGAIGFVAHWGEIEYRNIRIKVNR